MASGMARYRVFFGKRLLTGCGAALASGGALAGNAGNSFLQYGPLGSTADATAIPAMGGTGLILLSMLLVLAVWRLSRDGRIQGGRFMVVVLVSGALASGLSGVKLVSDVIAQPTPAFKDMSNNAGGVLAFTAAGAGGEIACVRNATEVSQRILAMQGGVRGFRVITDPVCDLVPFGQGDGPETAQICEVGLLLAPSEICGASSTPTGGNASDARLKTDIVPVGRHGNGLALYEFRYIGGATRYRGVMAQEVLLHTPAAVEVMPGGYLAVNYGMLGLEMTAVQ